MLYSTVLYYSTVSTVCRASTVCFVLYLCCKPARRPPRRQHSREARKSRQARNCGTRPRAHRLSTRQTMPALAAGETTAFAAAPDRLSRPRHSRCLRSTMPARSKMRRHSTVYTVKHSAQIYEEARKPRKLQFQIIWRPATAGTCR